MEPATRPSKKRGKNNVDARLQLLESQTRTLQAQNEVTQQMIAKLTEMVSSLQQQQQNQDRPNGPRKPSVTSINGEQIPQRRRAQSIAGIVSMESLVSAASPTPVLPSPSRSSSLSHVALAAASVALAKIARATTGKPAQSTASVVPMLTRRYMGSLHFNQIKQTRWQRFRRWARDLFTKSRTDSNAGTKAFRGLPTDENKLHPFTIHHESTARLFWDTLIRAVIMVDIVITPPTLSFQYNPHGIVVFDEVTNVLYAMDFFVNAFLSFSSADGVVISGPLRTIRHYILSPWAVADFISWFPFHVALTPVQTKLLGITKVVRLAKVGQLARRFNSSRQAGLIRLLQLFSVVFLVSHILACYWNWMATEWRIQDPGYLDKSLWSQYSRCWSLIIGSLNASPPAMFTPAEETSVAVFMLIGNVLQATVFGAVAVLISSFNEGESTYNKKIFDVYERCKLLDIPADLAERIRSYYERLYLETRSVDPDADSFINELSPALVSEIKFQLYRDMVTQIPFFSSAKIDPVVIEMLILHLRATIYMQDDVLIRKGESGDWMGFVGSKGSVGVLDPNTDSNIIVRVLQKGDYFGEMGLLRRTKRATTLVALAWVQVHVLSRRDLDEVKEQYAEEAEGLEEEIERFMTSRRHVSARNEQAGPSKKVMKMLM